MKDVLLIFGAAVGGGLTGVGLIALLNRPDPSTTYAGERLFDNIVGGVIGIPCLLVGLPLLGFCARALIR